MLNICKILLICHWFYVIVLTSAHHGGVPDAVFHELLPEEKQKMSRQTKG